jgi:hypothetical protein
MTELERAESGYEQMACFLIGPLFFILKNLKTLVLKWSEVDHVRNK